MIPVLCGSAIHPWQWSAHANAEQHGSALVSGSAGNTHDPLSTVLYAVSANPHVSWVADGRGPIPNLLRHGLRPVTLSSRALLSCHRLSTPSNYIDTDACLYLCGIEAKCPARNRCGSITLVSGGQCRFSSNALVGTQQCITADGMLRQYICPVALQHSTAVFLRLLPCRRCCYSTLYAVRLQ